MKEEFYGIYRKAFKGMGKLSFGRYRNRQVLKTVLDSICLSKLNSRKSKKTVQMSK